MSSLVKKNLSEYLINLIKLMRLDKPHGTLLLLLPTLQALFLAGKNDYKSIITLMPYLVFGTLIMRSAGCVINDIADRRIDKHVKRTAKRPITAGKISVYEAGVFTIFLLLIALYIVLQLPLQCFYCAILALGITIIYPFCKRFFYAPQMILGLAFSMGIPITYYALHAPIDGVFYLLFLINFIWIMSYDTIYALSDKEYDIKIGVKSTAVYFGKYVYVIIDILNILMHLLWVYIAIYLNKPISFLIPWVLGATVLVLQNRLVKKGYFLHAFRISVWYGAFILLGIII